MFISFSDGGPRTTYIHTWYITRLVEEVKCTFIYIKPGREQTSGGDGEIFIMEIALKQGCR